MKDKVSHIMRKTANSVKNTTHNVTSACMNLKEDTIKLVEKKIKDLIGRIKFDELYNALDKYEKETGKSAKILRDFVCKLEKYSSDN